MTCGYCDEPITDDDVWINMFFPNDGMFKPCHMIHLKAERNSK